MAKVTGLGDYLAVDDSGGSARDISDNVTSLTINSSQNLFDVTTLSKSAIERLIGLNDLTIDVTATVDTASNKSLDVFKDLSGTRTVTYSMGGNTSGKPRLQVECLLTGAPIARGADGALEISANLALQSGTTPAWDTVP